MPGAHGYYFQYSLPFELPTSVEARIGHIRYNARVVIDTPGAIDEKFDFPFTVIKAVNLNEIPALQVRTHLYDVDYEYLRL